MEKDLEKGSHSRPSTIEEDLSSGNVALSMRDYRPSVHSHTDDDDPGPCSPVLRRRPTIEDASEHSFTPQTPISMCGPRTSVEFSANNSVALDATAAPGSAALNLTWLVPHHNAELVHRITLQEPGQLARFAKAAWSWRPWVRDAATTTTTTAVTDPGGGGRDDQGGGPSSNVKDTRDSFRISIAELHRMRMRKLQCKLAKHAWFMRKSGSEPQGWEDDLQEYTKALQDYDYMTKCISAQRDSFLISGERKMDRFVMHEILGMTAEQFGRDPPGPPIPVLGPWEKENYPIGGTRNENVKKSSIRSFRRRLFMASLGGTFLVGPMWLMVMHNTMYTVLVSTSVFVYAFGFLMSILLEKPMEVLSGTAAYAAVLVVFVGIGSSGGANE